MHSHPTDHWKGQSDFPRYIDKPPLLGGCAGGQGAWAKYDSLAYPLHWLCFPNAFENISQPWSIRLKAGMHSRKTAIQFTDRAWLHRCMCSIYNIQNRLLTISTISTLKGVLYSSIQPFSSQSFVYFFENLEDSIPVFSEYGHDGTNNYTKMNLMYERQHSMHTKVRILPERIEQKMSTTICQLALIVAAAAVTEPELSIFLQGGCTELIRQRDKLLNLLCEHLYQRYHWVSLGASLHNLRV